MFPAGRKRASELGDAQAKELQGRASARDAVINRFRKARRSLWTRDGGKCPRQYKQLRLDGRGQPKTEDTLKE